MSDGQEQWRMMSADLYERAAIMVRNGEADDVADVAEMAERVINFNDPEGDYRLGLEAVGLSPEAIDAAVAAISRGEHPADSLPARLLTWHEEGSSEARAGAYHQDAYDEGRGLGRADVAALALDLLGCEVPT